MADINQMSEFRQPAIQQAVESLFKDRHFSICTLDRIIELTGNQVNHEIYMELHAFHCVHFSEMNPRVKQLLEQKVVECLRGEPFMNPARLLGAITDEGRDFTNTEDRYIDAPSGDQNRPLRLINQTLEPKKKKWWKK